MSTAKPDHAFPWELRPAFLAFFGLFAAVDLACGGWRDLLSPRWMAYGSAAYGLQIFAAVRDQPVFWERGAERGRIKIARDADRAVLVGPDTKEPVAPRAE